MSERIYFLISQTVDLARENAPMHYAQPLIGGDAEGHMWRVHVRRNGSDVPLEGYTVSAYVKRDIRHKDGKTEPAIYIPGKILEGDAVAVLASDIYAMNSPILCVMRVSDAEGQVVSAAVMTARAGDVIGGEISDPTGSIRNLEELLAEIKTMEAATADGRAAAADAQAAAQEARQTAEDMQGQMEAHKADTAAALSAQKDMKADAIMDTSARAASHSLHAQDGRMNVTLYGQTTETGTGDKSPENPYAIGGVGVADIHVGGKNLIPGWIVGETISDSKGSFMHQAVYRLQARTEFIPIQPGKAYILSGMPADVYCFVAFYDANKNYVRRTNAGAATSGAKTVTSTNTAGCYYAALTQYTHSSVSTDASVLNTDTAQFESGTEATPYEPYNANAYELPLLPDGAPLMGNGKIDDTSENDVLVDGERKCRVTRRWGKITIDGSADEGWAAISANKGVYRFGTKATAVPTGDGGKLANVLCDAYNTRTYYAVYDGGKGISAHTSTGRFYICDPDCTTLEAFTAKLAANPITAWYELSTPRIYTDAPIAIRKPSDIMPVTVTGSGETAVEYPHDTKHYIDSQIAAAVALALGN